MVPQDTFNCDNVLPLGVTNKIAQVTHRRNTMLSVEADNMRRLTEAWQEKVTLHSQHQEQEDLHTTRQKKWAGLISMFGRLLAMRHIVDNVRAVKAKDTKK